MSGILIYRLLSVSLVRRMEPYLQPYYLTPFSGSSCVQGLNPLPPICYSLYPYDRIVCRPCCVQALDYILIQK